MILLYYFFFSDTSKTYTYSMFNAGEGTQDSNYGGVGDMLIFLLTLLPRVNVFLCNEFGKLLITFGLRPIH